MRKINFFELENLTNEEKEKLLEENGYIATHGTDTDGCDEGTYYLNTSYILYDDEDEELHCICHDTLLAKKNDDEPDILQEEWHEQEYVEN